MPDPKRAEFITRHFKDLQTIRFAPVPALMLLAPFFVELDTSHASKATAWGFLLGLVGFLLFVVGFFRWSTVAIKRRYGTVKESRVEAQRMMSHPAIFVLFMISAAVASWFYFFGPRRRTTDVYCAFALFSTMLRTILDSTNPARRRLVWTIGLVALFGAGPFLIVNEVDGGAAILFLAGVVWLSISVFDFLLLRRTFEEISSSPSSRTTEAVAHFG
jgi:hypothetical protein